MLVKLSQFSNAAYPIFVTPFGIIIFEIGEFVKALFSIFLTVLEITTLVFLEGEAISVVILLF